MQKVNLQKNDLFLVGKKCTIRAVILFLPNSGHDLNLPQKKKFSNFFPIQNFFLQIFSLFTF